MCENIDSILDDFVEDCTLSYDGILNINDLRNEVNEMLGELEFESKIFFCDLLKSFRSIIQAVKQADGDHLKD